MSISTGLERHRRVITRNSFNGVGPIDIDGTALEEKVGVDEKTGEAISLTNAWLIFTEKIGGDPAIHRVIFGAFRDAYRGEFDTQSSDHYQKMKRELIHHWNEARQTTKNGEPITRAEVKRISKEIALLIRIEIYEIVEIFISAGIIPLIITGSFEDVAEAMAGVLELKQRVEPFLQVVPLFYGNSKFIYDENDVLIDFEYDVHEPIVKVEQVKTVLRRLKGLTGTRKEKKTVIPIGDGWSDTGLFREFGGIYIGQNKDYKTSGAKISVDTVQQVPLVLMKILLRLGINQSQDSNTSPGK